MPEQIRPRTPVAVLGTLAEFNRQPLRYDLAALVRLARGLRPDLLCLDMTPEQWRSRDFGGLPAEYREALLPLAEQSDIVVAPIAGEGGPGQLQAAGWRGWLIGRVRELLGVLQLTASGPAAINEGWRHHVADLLYILSGWLAGGDTLRAWRAHTTHLTRQVLEVARRDPGRRMLVVVDVRHCHHIRPALRRSPEIQVVRYADLARTGE